MKIQKSLSFFFFLFKDIQCAIKCLWKSVKKRVKIGGGAESVAEFLGFIVFIHVVWSR